MDDNDSDDVAMVPMDETARGPDAPAVAVVPREPVAPLTSVRPLLDAPLANVGRAIAIPNLRVTEVVGDAAFYVATSHDAADRRFFVWLVEEPTPDHPEIEGRYDVNAGQTLTVYGTVERLENMDPAHWGITAAEAEKMKDDLILLRAERLDITDAELDVVEVN